LLGREGIERGNVIIFSVRLTQIKLSGFKSFVDPTSINVPGQLVGVVGPNGCGKSNVIDAVRWVLGETRASALRGDSMQDVIFNGSGNRPPHARASVELSFDNSQGRAAGQWSQYAEIAVKRVLQRDGESSYYINGVHVRRRDITDMFLGTGLGPRAYAIIEQGMISRVIEAKPEELRVFLEEAAGISKYKERRRETENRLADTRENLSRITDIRLELGAQLEKLESQAKIAARYKEIQSDLSLKQHLLWYLRRRDAGAERERHASEIARIGNEMEAENAQLRHLESRLETARTAHYQAGDAMNGAQAALYTANATVASHESQLRYAEETRSRLENQHTERRAQLASWREQRSQLTLALHMWASRSGTARERAVQAKRKLEQESGLLPQAEDAFRAAQEAANEARSGLQQSESGLQLERANLAHHERTVHALGQRRERLAAELQTLAAPDGAAASAVQAGMRDLEASLSSARSRLEALQSESAAAEEERAAATESLNAAQRDETTAQAQLATLRQIQADTENNAPLRDWLDRHAFGSLPRLFQKLRIDSGWEAAVEAVLRERLHALEASGIDRLPSEMPPAKASLFERGSAPATEPVAGLTPLAAHVHAADPAVSGALADWLADVYAVEGQPARESLRPGMVLVNREGHQFTRHTISFHAPDAVDAGILARQAEIEKLEVRCQELEKARQAAEGELQAAETRAAERSEALEAARAGISRMEKARHDAEIDELKLAQSEERYRERSAEIEEIDRETEKARQALAACQLAIARGEEAIQAAAERLEAARQALATAENGVIAQRKGAHDAEREVQDAVFGERECASKIAEIDNSVKVIDQQIEHAEQEIAKLTTELAADPIPEVKRQLESAVEARLICEKTLATARDAVEAAAAALREIEESRLQVESRAAPLRERLNELKLKEQAAQINHDQFAGQLQEAGADEALLAGHAEAAPRPSALQGEITRLTGQINELGAVNMAALEELSSSQERKGFLDSQATDLEEAVKTLEDAIRKIDRETRELLRETFDAVNKHFGSLFPTLFGGGEAKLIMTGEEILDAGVQVMAQPPGKKNTSIHLLSGGEKALTAISLVFSLFQLNPAPFCLLDEVDAPLDDSNTIRFCDLVKRMAAQTQFLFISHNKIAMEMAEQLIGVTMPESGVSRVVAVDIDEALRIREEMAA
jgi:chromosome segregation protein